MENTTVTKYELYKAIAYAVLLTASAFPLSLIGLNVINFIFTRLPQ
jgi:hypothetical protein